MTWTSPLLIGGPVSTLVGLAVVVVLLAATSSSIEVVDATEARALIVLGEYRRILQPGVSLVPPFVSQTYSIDVRTQELELSIDDARSRDGEPASVDLRVEARVSDPETAFRSDEDAFVTVRERALGAVYDEVRAREFDDLVEYPGDVAAAVDRELRGADDWGVEVRRVTTENVERAAGAGAA